MQALAGASAMGLSNAAAVVDNASIYTDFSGLDRLKASARQNEEGALHEVAKQFESIFLSIALKSMRDANAAFAKDNYFDSQQSHMYRDMLDQQLSLTLSQGQGVGLAESLVQQLKGYVSYAPDDLPSRLDVEA